MEGDRKLSMGMRPPVSIVHCCVCYPRSAAYPAVGSLRGEWVFFCLCCVRHKYIGIKKKIPLKRLPERRGLLGNGEALGLSGGPYSICIQN